VVSEPLEILLVGIGTQGDVLPLATLGAALKARGHDVTLVADAMHARLGAAAGLAFQASALPEPAAQAAAHPQLWHHRRGFRIVLDGFVLPALQPTYDYVVRRWDSRRKPLVVAGTTWALGPRIAHEKLKVPFVTLHLCPTNLRSNCLPPEFAGLRMTPAWPDFVKTLAWWLLDRAYLDPKVLPALNAFRRTLGLGDVDRVMQGWLHSPQAIIGLFPPWFAPPQPDWPAQTQLTGFVLPPDAVPLPPALEAFLDAGPAPLVFTFGSAIPPARRLFEQAATVCRRLGVRGVLLGHDASAPPAELPDGVRFFGYVPLGALLPRASALVHHGGIGTSALALRAGAPQLVLPIAFDQIDNATRLERLGVAAQLPWHSVNDGRLAHAIEAMLGSTSQREACVQHAERFAGDSGATEQSCHLIEAAAQARS
jgi:UDP:flavonoid glycosyltransferase YjiC (YdhE family)